MLGGVINMIQEDIEITDKVGTKKKLNNETLLYDTVNKMEIKANYMECLNPEIGWNMIIDNLLSGRLLFNAP